MNEDQIVLLQEISDNPVTLPKVKEAVLQAIIDTRKLKDILSAAEELLRRIK